MHESYRDVEEILRVRGVIVTYEAIREWCLKFGQAYANELRRRRPRPGDKWHLDEVFIKINGKDHYLWRAVDQNGNVLDILVQSRRNKKAAKRFFRKLLKGLQYVPRVIITDKLKSYSAAKAEILPGVERRRHKGLNGCVATIISGRAKTSTAFLYAAIWKSEATNFACPIASLPANLLTCPL